MVRKFTTPVELPADPSSALQASTKQYADRLTSRTSVRSYGAVGNGSTDDTTAIQDAVAACPAGGIVFFPPGLYAVSAPIVVPPQITLEGSHGQTIQYTGAAATPTSINTLAGFTGAAVLRLLGKADQSPTGSLDHIGTRIRDLTIDGTAGPAGVKGVQVAGNVRELLLERVTVREVTDTGFWFGAGATSGLMPASFRLVGCLADSCGNNGYTFTNTPDATLIDCNALGNTNVGFYVAGFMNGQIANCRAEWSGLQGFYFTSGYWGSGQGSGGCNVLACSTDRSGQDGIRIDATGNGTLQFTNCFNRRDGRNGGTGGGGYAGFSVLSAATMPVVVDNHQVYPGVDDGGAGTNSPQYGFQTANTGPVTLNSGYIWGATTALNVATTTIVASNVGTATGLTSAPTRVAPTRAAPLASPTFTGTVTVPTPSNTTDAATKAYVDSTDAANAAIADVQIFTTAGTFTWTKPTGATSVNIVGIGSGGGGGGGGRAPSGTAYSGGAGGGGGGYASTTVPASVLASSLSVVIGTGGTGGAAATASSTGGSAGGNGANTVVADTAYYLVCFGAAGGPGGSSATATGPGGGGAVLGGGAGGTGTTGSAGAAGGGTAISAGGGGSGAGLAGTQAALAGGTGGGASQTQSGSGAGAAATGSAVGGSATALRTNLPGGGGGGGGGGSRIGAASGNGGAGGLYGGGGGGGATSQNGQVAGTGGAGATGIVVITTYF